MKSCGVANCNRREICETAVEASTSVLGQDSGSRREYSRGER